MKSFTSMPWMAYACLLMEALALVFVALVLVCPAPFQHNRLSIIVIQPNYASSISNATLTPITNGTTLSVPSSISTSIPAINNITRSTSTSPGETSTAETKGTTTLSRPTSSSTNVNLSSTTTGDASSAPTAAPTLLPRADSNATSDSFDANIPLHNIITSAENNGTVSEHDGDLARITQLERLNSTTLPLGATNSSINAKPLNTSSILMKIGPLGSCFRNSNNVETCTTAKINSQYDFSQLQQSIFIISGLPSGMSTFPTILLVIIVVLILKVAQNVTVLFVPDQHLPSSISSAASGWHTICNWLVCIVGLLLAIASGVQRNKMSTAVKSFNTANQTNTMNSVPLLAQTGTSFGFIWISVLLLAASFLFNRIAIKRQAMLDRAKQQLLADPANRYNIEQQPLPMYSRSSYKFNNVHEAAKAVETKRYSGLQSIREYLQSSKRADDASSRTPHSGSEISLPTKVLDDYIRRHYHPSDYESELPKAVKVDYLNDTRRFAKESPPFHAYQSSLDGDYHHRRQEEANYVEEVRHRLATPAPSYWTMPERDQQDSPQSRREKEREYMAELRRQRSTMH